MWDCQQCGHATPCIPLSHSLHPSPPPRPPTRSPHIARCNLQRVPNIVCGTSPRTRVVSYTCCIQSEQRSCPPTLSGTNNIVNSVCTPRTSGARDSPTSIHAENAGPAAGRSRDCGTDRDMHPVLVHHRLAVPALHYRPSALGAVRI